ncbi:MAG: IclR family transcriptional regulator [Micrococcaceae bacterium]
MTASDTTLDRLIRILEAFDATAPQLTVAELAVRADLPLPTAYRWVERLHGSGLLRRHRDGTVGPGLRLWELAARSSPTSSLRAAAMPYLDDVHAVLRQHTQLAVLDDDGVLVLERLSARGAVANQATVAGRLPLFTTSMGLTLLAFSRPHITETLLERHHHRLGMPVRRPAGEHGTAVGVVNPTEPELRALLAEVRRTGYATVHGRLDVDTTGVAVPIELPQRTALGAAGVLPDAVGRDTVAALGVVVPAHSELAPGLAPMLMAAARGITRTLAQNADSH